MQFKRQSSHTTSTFYNFLRSASDDLLLTTTNPHRSDQSIGPRLQVSIAVCLGLPSSLPPRTSWCSSALRLGFFSRAWLVFLFFSCLGGSPQGLGVRCLTVACGECARSISTSSSLMAFVMGTCPVRCQSSWFKIRSDDLPYVLFPGAVRADPDHCVR
jgi:hypothetical protein